MTSELLRQADIVLSRCGRPLSPPGTRIVAIPKRFKCWAVFAATPTSLVSTVPASITGDTTWMFRAVSSLVNNPVGLAIQIQAPDGRFLFHDLADVRSVAGYGSQRWPLTHPRACPPGSKVVVTFQDTTPAVGQAIPLLLEGSYFYHVKVAGAPVAARNLASTLPRYIPGRDQNIMAPCWMWGEGPSTPQGFEDKAFIYHSPVGAIDVGAATPKNLTLEIQTEYGSDFPLRQLFFNVTFETALGLPAVGKVLVKVRSSSGYILTDDYVLTSIINGVPLPKDWNVKAGETLFFDLSLVDYSGTGNVFIQCFAKGVKRRNV